MGKADSMTADVNHPPATDASWQGYSGHVWRMLGQNGVERREEVPVLVEKREGRRDTIRWLGANKLTHAEGCGCMHEASV